MHVVPGDLGVAIKGMVDEFQAVSKSNQKIQSIADMQRFVENYPEFRAKSGNVSKHVTLMGELSRLIDERHLMQVSQVEQARSLPPPHAHCSSLSPHLGRAGPRMRLVGPHGGICVRDGAAGKPRGASFNRGLTSCDSSQWPGCADSRAREAAAGAAVFAAIRA